MRLDPATTTDADIKDYLITLKKMHKKYELTPMYQQACGGEMYAVKGQNKDGMILRILGEAIGEIGEFDIDGQTMAPSTLTINRFKECPDPGTNGATPECNCSGCDCGMECKPECATNS